MFTEEIKRIKRGCFLLVSEEELKEKLRLSKESGKPLIVKYGADPTASDLHLGHAVVMKKLRTFQELGHKVVFLIGDFTARIGDPTGRDITRPPLSKDDVEKNAKTYIEQMGKIVDMSKVEVVYNSSWLSNINLEDLIRLLSQFTLSRMLEHNTFEKRLKENISIRMHEFIYPFLQAYDSVHLKADVEVGGSDQVFNINFGRDMQKFFDQPPQIALTMPILTGIDGEKKMSKSLGNHIGITFSPNDMFERIMQMPDTNIVSYYELLTDVSEDEIKDIEQNLTSPPYSEYARDVKLKLAHIIVSDFHSKEQANEAKRIYLKEGIDSITISKSESKNGKIWVVKLALLVGKLKSNGEARRLIRGGGFKINGSKITDENMEIDIDEDIVVQIGKKRPYKIVYN